MMENLRIARLDSRRYQPVAAALMGQHQDLIRLIRRYLPHVTGSLLAAPKPHADGETIEWYSDLAGQPVKLADLPAPQQQAARTLLADRLHSIRDLAERLGTVEPDALPLQQALKQALHYPGEDTVYVVEGQPVLTFWGHQDPRAAAPPAEQAPASPPRSAQPEAAVPVPPPGAVPPPRSGRRWPRWLTGLLLVLLLAGLLGWFWDRLPIKNWFAPDYWAMYQAATGNCDTIAQLDTELNRADAVMSDSLPAVRAAVAKEHRQCETPDYWAMYQAASGDCDRIKRLETELSQPELLPAAELAAVKAAVTKASQQCDIPDYWAMFQAATGDCDKIKQLDTELNQPDVVNAPELPAVKNTVSDERRQCDLPDYRALYQAAKDDCPKISELHQYLAQPDREVTPALPEVRALVQQDFDQCLLAQYQPLLAQARDDCEKLQAIQSQMETISASRQGELHKIYSQYQQLTGQCQVTQLAQRFERVKKDCAQLKTFAASLPETGKQLPGYSTLQQTVDQKLALCNQPKQAPVQSKKRTPPADPRQLCPGERPKELAPDLALVFDASNSMNESMIMGAVGRAGAQMGGALGLGIAILNNMSEKRIDVAKKAASRVISSLPQDVDAGLVLVNECPRARQEGFYSPQQRGVLLQRINRIRAVGGTPLASGMQQASAMVDGVNAPAVIVVISDGAESCNGNPCAVARAIAQAKPLLKINVVDIMGTGAANCAAHITGGRVLTANNASDLQQMLNTAVEEVKGPSHCIRR